MQNITVETLWSIMILLPGIAWSLIWMKYSKNKPQTDKFYFLVYSISASAFSYLFCGIFSDFNITNLINSYEHNNENLKIIASSTAISVFLGAICSYLSHKAPIIKLMQKLRIEVSDGEVDLLVASIHKHLTLGKKALIRIYDLESDRIYQGLITKVSEARSNNEFIELIIAKCDIYNNDTGNFLLRIEELYLNLNSKKLLIEFIKI